MPETALDSKQETHIGCIRVQYAMVTAVRLSDGRRSEEIRRGRRKMRDLMLKYDGIFGLIL